MRTKTYTVKDLRSGSITSNAMQLCRVCGNTYSVTAGDYFMASDSMPLKCCGEPVAIVTKATVYTDVNL